jgi:hypothetical protein
MASTSRTVGSRLVQCEGVLWRQKSTGKENAAAVSPAGRRPHSAHSILGFNLLDVLRSPWVKQYFTIESGNLCYYNGVPDFLPASSDRSTTPPHSSRAHTPTKPSDTTSAAGEPVQKWPISSMVDVFFSKAQHGYVFLRCPLTPSLLCKDHCVNCL